MFGFKIFRIGLLVAVLSIFANFTNCTEAGVESPAEEEPFLSWNSLIVSASAYNSLPAQGSGNVNITAFGDTLVPGMRSIAVSADLLEKGLVYGTEVKIQGLEGSYVVNDKMHPRWKNKIDIYMGVDRKKALQWGRKKVEICFPVAIEEEE